MANAVFTTGQELISFCEKEHISISKAMRLREEALFETEEEKQLSFMRASWEVMKQSVHDGWQMGNRSMGGLIGGESYKMSIFRVQGRSILGETVSKAVSYAMGVLEINASMGLIVAAPTAGSSGVIPGVLCALQETYGFTDDQMVQALFTAGAVGYLITRNSTVSGAEGGCQAEMGSAAAMAAAAVTELFGGSPRAALSAAGSVLVTMLGLVCDPIGGLVEAPCQKRNAAAAANALVCAEMALSGVQALVPFDEMVEVARRVGRSIPYELRETALGGVAAAPTACALCGGCDRP